MYRDWHAFISSSNTLLNLRNWCGPLSALKKVFVRKVDVLGLLRGNVTFCLRNENAEETNWCLASD